MWTMYKDMRMSAYYKDTIGDMVGIETFSVNHFTLKNKTGWIKVCYHDTNTILARFRGKATIELTEKERERVRSILVMEAL